MCAQLALYIGVKCGVRLHGGSGQGGDVPVYRAADGRVTADAALPQGPATL